MISTQQNLTSYVMESLGNLTPDELHILERAITPRIAFLLSKAFGPEMGVLTWPLIMNDEQDDDGSEWENDCDCGPDCNCAPCQAAYH